MRTIGGRWRGRGGLAAATVLAAFALGCGSGNQGLGAQEPAQQQDDRRPGVGVFPLEDGGSYGADQQDLEALQVGLQQMLLTELDQSTDLRIVERSALREILEEQDLVEAGRVDANTAAQVGRIVGARYMITGGFVDLDRDFRLDARVVDVETSEVLGSQSVRGDRSEMYDLVVEMASNMMERVDLPPLPAEQRQERSDRDIPGEAVALYSRALALEERGETDRAVELYQRIVEEFPDMVEAEEALQQIG